MDTRNNGNKITVGDVEAANEILSHFTLCYDSHEISPSPVALEEFLLAKCRRISIEDEENIKEIEKDKIYRKKCAISDEENGNSEAYLKELKNKAKKISKIISTSETQIEEKKRNVIKYDKESAEWMRKNKAGPWSEYKKTDTIDDAEEDKRFNYILNLPSMQKQQKKDANKKETQFNLPDKKPTIYTNIVKETIDDKEVMLIQCWQFYPNNHTDIIPSFHVGDWERFEVMCIQEQGKWVAKELKTPAHGDTYQAQRIDLKPDEQRLNEAFSNLKAENALGKPLFGQIPENSYAKKNINVYVEAGGHGTRVEKSRLNQNFARANGQGGRVCCKDANIINLTQNIEDDTLTQKDKESRKVFDALGDMRFSSSNDAKIDIRKNKNSFHCNIKHNLCFSKKYKEYGKLHEKFDEEKADQYYQLAVKHGPEIAARFNKILTGKGGKDKDTKKARDIPHDDRVNAANDFYKEIVDTNFTGQGGIYLSSDNNKVFSNKTIIEVIFNKIKKFFGITPGKSFDHEEYIKKNKNVVVNESKFGSGSVGSTGRIIEETNPHQSVESQNEAAKESSLILVDKEKKQEDYGKGLSPVFGMRHVNSNSNSDWVKTSNEEKKPEDQKDQEDQEKEMKHKPTH